jgi:acyl-CoA thioester hydrolase
MTTAGPALGRWPIRVEVPVAWGDMDALGHVNNVVYLRWFETGRIAYFTSLVNRPGIPAGAGPILARQTIDYRLQLSHPDVVRIEVTIERLGTTSMVMPFRIRSRAKEWAIAAEGDGVLVLFDYARGTKIAIDEAMRKAVEEFEAGGPPAS